jgi:intracellular septation protein
VADTRHAEVLPAGAARHDLAADRLTAGQDLQYRKRNTGKKSMAKRQADESPGESGPAQSPMPAAAPDATARGDSEVDTKQLLKMMIELAPLLVFFGVNYVSKDIILGTGVFMVATLAALVASRMLFGRIPVMPLVSGALVLVFGGLTIWSDNALFIKLKPTIVNLIFASILFGGLYFGKSLLRYVLGEVFKLTDEGWRILTMRWAIFFVVLAVVNEIVWRNFSESFWIGFKLMGVMPLTAVFGLSQMGLLKRYGLGENAATNGTH